jgi:hypothetical protein
MAANALGCSSSSGTTADPADAAAAPADGSPALTGVCATLAACCPSIGDPSTRDGCVLGADLSRDDQAVCADALATYGPKCGLTALDSGLPADAGPVDSGASNCGSVGATPAPMPAECAAIGGACIFHEHDTAQKGAQTVCLEYGGQWSQIASAAGTQCMGGGPAGMHEWVAGKHCSEVVTGIQGGCETHTSGSALCTTVYFGPGCATALGSSCNNNASANGVWVSP